MRGIAYGTMSLESLSQILPNERIKTDAASLEFYGKDWTKHIVPKPSAIVFPISTQEVQNLVRWARAHKTALVPSGGRTGLSGAAIATNNEVVVSFEKMNKVIEFDEFDQTVTIQPGFITEQLQKFAEDKGLYFPVDFASRGSSQIGGNISTNAGGIKVLRYGLFRNWVAGLEVVTGAGEILTLNGGLVKNATGYDLRQLFIGAEGTLGFITQATLALTRKPRNPSLFLFAVPELSGVMKIYHSYKSQLPVLAFEMFTEECLREVLAHTHLPRPLEEKAPYYVLLEIEGDSDDVLEPSMELFERAVADGWIAGGTLSQSPQQFRDFWRLREDISEATAKHKPYKNDISVRVSRVPKLLEDMNQILKTEYPQFTVCWFGHIGDGNLHINILKPDGLSAEEFLRHCKGVDQKLMGLIEKLQGSISAEHGVGLTKKPYLHMTRSRTEIDYMKQLKRVFDPDGIMNPGKIFDV